MKLTTTQILDLLPYDRPFRFVDSIDSIGDENIIGKYQIKDDEYFLDGHFRNNPVVPGVIISEIMAQIGVVCLGLYLAGSKDEPSKILPVFSNMNIDFLMQAFPGDKLRIESKLKYFRLGKLKTYVRCYRENELIAHGDISGVLSPC